MTIRRVISATREDLIEALADEHGAASATVEAGKTLRSRQVAEGRADGLAFAIALLTDWDGEGKPTFMAEAKAPEAKHDSHDTKP